MNVKERQHEFTKFSQEQSSILYSKGHDYTGGRAEKDAYANFRMIAFLMRGSPLTAYTVAIIYYLKHIFSCITFAQTGRQESDEPIHGRHLDLANYAFILDQLVPAHETYFEMVALQKLYREQEAESLKREEEEGEENGKEEVDQNPEPDIAEKTPEQLKDELRKVGKWPMNRIDFELCSCNACKNHRDGKHFDGDK